MAPAQATAGRRPADRRIRVERTAAHRTSATPAGRRPDGPPRGDRPDRPGRTVRRGHAPARCSAVRWPATRKPSERLSIVEGAGGLLERQPLVGRLRDRGDHVHAPGRGHRRVLADASRSRSSSWPSSGSSSSPTARRSAPTRTAAASYIVAKDNLGQLAGLVAAAALLVDYVLTVSVSVAAGIAAITSAFPGLLDDIRVAAGGGQHRARRCSSTCAASARAGRSSPSRPTSSSSRCSPSSRSASAGRCSATPPQVTGVTPVVVPAETLGLLLLMRAFADGCSAITGVEAVSNGVPAFQRPEAAQRPDDAGRHGRPGRRHVPGHVLSRRASPAPSRPRARRSSRRSVAPSSGRAPSYYVLQLSTMGILVLAANTSFADFPRLSSLLARDGFMPSRFAFRGERLAFSAGIVALAVLSIVVLAAFGGRVEALIPLYAIGVFTSITLSQAGMVVHWWRDRDEGWRRSLADQRRRRRRDRHRRPSSSRSRSSPSGRGCRDHHPGPRRRDAVHRPPHTGADGSRPRSRGDRHRPADAAISGSSSRSSDVTRDVVQAIRSRGRCPTMSRAVHVTDDVDGRGAIRARGSSGSSRACRWSSSSRRTGRSSRRSSGTSRTPRRRAGRRRHRAAPRVRAAAPVGTAPLQRERPPDRARRSLGRAEHPRGARSRTRAGRRRTASRIGRRERSAARRG